MDINTALAFAGAVFIITIKPGPGVLACVSRSLADGWIFGSAIALGICLVHVVYLSIASLTFAIAQEHVEFISILLKALGGTLMIYLGIKEFMRIDNPLVMPSGNGSRAHDLLRNFMTGIMICLGNPLVIFFYAALVPSVMNVSLLSVADIAMCALLLLVFNWGVLTAMCMGSDAVHGFLSDAEKARPLRILTAVMFILIGILMGVSAMPFLDWGHIYYGAEHAQ